MNLKTVTVTHSVPTMSRRADGLGFRSPRNPQKMPAICERCAKQQDVWSGPPGSEVVRDLTCDCCGHTWKCTVKRGAL